MIIQLNDISQIWWQWMGSMFWQVSLLIILVTAIDMVIRKWAWPQVRYALWALVFIKLIITPAWQMPTSIVSWIQPQVEDQITFKVEVTEKTEKSSAKLNTPDEVKAPVIIEQASWQSFALLIWLSGIAIFALMLIRKMYKFLKIHRVDDNTGSPEWFNELIIKTAARLKLRKTPSVLFSEDAKSPAVYGVFRPVLLLPHGYLDKLSNEQAEHVLMHELCHLKRGDLLVHWFCIIVQIVYWFNPLLIWTRRQMRYVCEICCDLSVANILKEKTMSYRETLLHSARELFAENLEPSLGFLGIFEEPFRLVPRLKWLEKRSWENRRRRIVTTICTSLFMIICVMPMAGISQTTEYGSSDISPLTDKASKNQTLQQIDLNIADLNKKIDKTNKQLKEYLEFVENSPTGDMEILRLNKENKNLKDKYDLLLKKKLGAEISLSRLKKENQDVSKKEEMEKLSETSTSLNDELESARKLFQDKEKELKNYENSLSEENQSIRKLAHIAIDFNSMKDLYNTMLDRKSEADIAVSMDKGKDNPRTYGTSIFLENELGSIEKRLVEKEKELNAFKEFNANSLPENIKESLINIEKLQKLIDQLNVYLRENKTNRSTLLRDALDSNATNDADEVRKS